MYLHYELVKLILQKKCLQSQTVLFLHSYAPSKITLAPWMPRYGAQKNTLLPAALVRSCLKDFPNAQISF